MEYLRDPVWQVAGVVLAILVPCLIFWAQRERKTLTFEVTTDISLVSVRQQSLRDVEVRFKNQPMKDPGLIVVKFANSGNKPIVAADYETPVQMAFDAGTKVLSAEIVGVHPLSLSIEASITSSNTVVFTKALLNPGDSFQCRALVDGTGSTTISGRIAGVSDISKAQDRAWIAPATSIASMSLAVFSFFLSPGPSSQQLRDLRSDEVPYLVAVAIFLALACVAMMVSMVATLKRLVSPRALRRAQRAKRAG